MIVILQLLESVLGVPDSAVWWQGKFPNTLLQALQQDTPLNSEEHSGIALLQPKAHKPVIVDILKIIYSKYKMSDILTYYTQFKNLIDLSVPLLQCM